MKKSYLGGRHEQFMLNFLKLRPESGVGIKLIRKFDPSVSMFACVGVSRGSVQGEMNRERWGICEGRTWGAKEWQGKRGISVNSYAAIDEQPSGLFSVFVLSNVAHFS